MYGKIFESMYKGTLHGRWEAIVTFQQLIVLCDSEGVVDMTPPAIAATTSIPLKIIEKGLRDLQESDQYSRSTNEDGKRIILVDEDRPWGWVIVNHDYYRNLASKEDKREKDRVRMAEKRSKNKDVANSRGESRKSPIQIQDTNTNTNTNLTKHEYMETAKWMYQKILLINPKHKKPNFEKWADQIRKIIELDKRTIPEFKTVYIWVNNDYDFWRGNILSPDKLRKQWDRLTIQMNKNNGQSKGGTSKIQRAMQSIKQGRTHV